MLFIDSMLMFKKKTKKALEGISAWRGLSAVILVVWVLMTWAAEGALLSIGVVLRLILATHDCVVILLLKGKEIFNWRKFQSSHCSGWLWAWRHTHRVRPSRDKVLPTAAWRHLQVGTAIISCGSWDFRHPSQDLHTFTAIQIWISAGVVADERPSHVWSAAGLGMLLRSEMVRDTNVVGCIFDPVWVWCRLQHYNLEWADDKLTWLSLLSEQWLRWAAAPPAQSLRLSTPAASLKTVKSMRAEVSAWIKQKDLNPKKLHSAQLFLPHWWAGYSLSWQLNPE